MTSSFAFDQEWLEETGISCSVIKKRGIIKIVSTI